MFLTKVDVGGVGGCQIGFSCLAFGPAHSEEKKKVDKSFSYSQLICWGASNPSGKVDKRWILGGGAIVSFRKRQIFDRGGKVLS